MSLTGSDSIANWDFRNNFVQSNVDPGGSFIRGASVLLAAGPPSISQATQSRSSSAGLNAVTSVNKDFLLNAYPIGLVDNIGVTQSKGLQQIFEIGSQRKYFIPGQVVNSFNLARVMFDKASLMKVLYHYYIPADQSYNDPSSLVKTGGKDQEAQVNIKNHPGFDQTFLNLGSELFNRPIGLLMLMHNANDEGVAAVYLEYCFLQGHQFNINSASTLFAEQIQGMFDRIVPINMNFERLFR